MEKRKSKKRTSIIIDSNIIIASLRSRGLTRKILFSRRLQKKFQVITLDYCFKEIWQYRQRWNIRNLPDEDLIKILDFFFYEKVQFYPTNKIKTTILEAYKLMKPIDEKDTPILALAMFVQGLIWSNDAHFKKQTQIDCFTTAELKDLLKITLE
ncbi:MAG: hypothetical protein HWN65_20555 [Candidatus Helarchaeota archaeon]|nr:hypothetical protein [Candidatus Helarchaeota archaeon]